MPKGSNERPFVIGVGNRLRSDDGAGPVVADRLRDRGFEVLEMPGDGAEIMEAWNGRRYVVAVDAARSGSAPGTVHRFEASESPLPTGFFSYSTHQFGLAEAVETARALGRLPERLVIYGIEGAEFGFGEEIGEAVAEACAAVAAEISGGR